MLTLLAIGLLVWLSFFHFTAACVVTVALVIGYVSYKFLKFIFSLDTFSAINYGLALLLFALSGYAILFIVVT